MCQSCIGCGKCTGEVRPPIAPGVCPFCGAENDPNDARCAACGNPLPAPPGASLLDR